MTNHRILDFSESPARLRVKFQQLIVQRPDESDVSLPLAELAVVIAAHPQLTYTHAVLAGLAAAGGVFVTCDGKNLPVGMLLPLAAHFAQAERFSAQARASLPTRKRVWQQIIKAKIKAQANLLMELHGSDNGVAALADQVHSGDPSNVEARAARRYWSLLFADAKFRRDREHEDQNLLLNYGYAVLRAIVARAICAAGLHPSLGIHHHNKYNAYCLADDLMEPFRPTVDKAVTEYVNSHEPINRIEASAKKTIISELTGRYIVGCEQRTLFDTVGRIANSLADVFMGNADRIDLPEW